MPRARLLELVADAEDFVSRSLDSDQPAMRHMSRQLDTLLGQGAFHEDAMLADRIATMVLDLMALILGAGRGIAESAGVRGLRAARLQAIVEAITRGAVAPGFSVHTVASRLGLSPRYVQDILHQTGTSFTEHVLEHRMQRARAMLTDRRFARHRIIDIVLASGFSDVSYFNRAFRRRFGQSPSDMRQARGEWDRLT